ERHAEKYDTRPERKLHGERDEHGRARDTPGGTLEQCRRECDQEQRRDDRTEPMSEVHRDAGGVIEDTALVVDADPAPQHEGLVEIGDLGPPLRLARREVWARERRVIRAGPAA